MITQTVRTSGGSYEARNGRRESYGNRRWYELRTTGGTRIVIQDGIVYKDKMYGEVLWEDQHGNRGAIAWARRYLTAIDDRGE